jgi:hypothetical protein
MTLLNAFPHTEQPADRGGVRETDALVYDALDLLQRNGFDASLMPADDAFAVDIAVTHPTTGLYALGSSSTRPVMRCCPARAQERSGGRNSCCARECGCIESFPPLGCRIQPPNAKD